jgi:hypothetical protein
MLAGRPPAGEQGDDDRRQVPGAGAAGQPGGLLDVGLGVGGADTGDGPARGVGQVGQPVGARLHMLAGVGEQQPDLVIGSLFALSCIDQRGEQRITPTRSPACPRGRSSTETRTTSRGSPKRPIPGADQRTDRPTDARGPASTDKLHEITTALCAAQHHVPRCRIEPYLDQGGACGAASGAPRAGLCLGRPAQRARAVPLPGITDPTALPGQGRVSRLPRLRLSGSRPLRPGRPSGPSHANAA